LIHLFAVISPGPDFIIVARQSLNGRRSGILTSLGIALGILFHALYCILGVGYLIINNIYIFNIIKVLGVLYLCYLGIISIFFAQENYFLTQECNKNKRRSDFLVGFITNLLNPKATLFFISLFSLVIDVDTSVYIQLFYGFWMSVVTALWFCLVSLLISSYYSNIFINKYFTLLNRIMGIVLILISIKIILV